MENQMFFKAFTLDGTYIGVTSSAFYCRWQKKHNILIFCPVNDAQYILCGKDVYHVDWLKAECDEVKGKYEECRLIEITEEEYDTISGMDDYEPLPMDDYELEEEYTDDDLTRLDKASIGYIKEQKIAALQAVCKRRILDGITVDNNGKAEHYSMSRDDQINIMAMYSSILAGRTSGDNGLAHDNYLPYHADGEPCRMYSEDEIINIAKMMQEKVTMETTYFNSLKIYVDSLDTLPEIYSIEYGDEIPEKYQTEVYKALFNKEI